MNLKAWFDSDDRAVSPVIGVILMVAITVILAAVIASMTLGLGDSAQSAPTAKFDMENNPNAGDSGYLSISHMSGATFDGDNTQQLVVKVNGDRVDVYTDNTLADDADPGDDDGNDYWASSITSDDKSQNFAASGSVGAGSTVFVAGEDISSGDKVSLIWVGEDGSTSNTVTTYEIP